MFIKKLLIKVLRYALENTSVGDFIEKRPQHICFPVNIVKLLRTPILKHSYELLLLIFEFMAKQLLFLEFMAML